MVCRSCCSFKLDEANATMRNADYSMIIYIEMSEYHNDDMAYIVRYVTIWLLAEMKEIQGLSLAKIWKVKHIPYTSNLSWKIFSWHDLCSTFNISVKSSSNSTFWECFIIFRTSRVQNCHWNSKEKRKMEKHPRQVLYAWELQTETKRLDHTLFYLYQ